MFGYHSSSGHSENNRRTHHHGVAARIRVATVVAWGMTLALATPASAAPPPEDDQISAQAVGARATGTMHWDTYQVGTLRLTVYDTDTSNAPAAHVGFRLIYANGVVSGDVELGAAGPS